MCIENMLEGLEISTPGRQWAMSKHEVRDLANRFEQGGQNNALPKGEGTRMSKEIYIANRMKKKCPVHLVPEVEQKMS